MIRAALPFLLLLPSAAAAATLQEIADLCATNPAYSQSVMRNVLDAQLARDHDPSLDDAPPDQIAAQAVRQGITDCTHDLERDPALYQALAALSAGERPVAWDAYNTACSDRGTSKGACVVAEVGAMRALKHMAATDEPPGAHAIVQDCELVLKGVPTMTDWRECVDLSLAAHAPPARAAACKLSLSWHVATTGRDAGQRVAACLAGR